MSQEYLPSFFFLNMNMLLPSVSSPHVHARRRRAVWIWTRQLKNSTKSPGGQSDDIGQQLSWCWSWCFPSWFYTVVCMLFVYDMTLWTSFSPRLSCSVALRAWPSNAATVIRSYQHHSCHLLWGKVHAWLLWGRRGFAKMQSTDTVLGVREQTSVQSLQCWEAAGFKGVDSWLGCSHGEGRSILDSHFSLLTKKWSWLSPPRMEWCVLQCGSEDDRGRKIWGGQKDPIYPPYAGLVLRTGNILSSWTSGSSSECSYLASWQVVYWAKPEGIEHPCVISSSWSPSPRYRLAPGEHHLRYIPLRGFSRIPLHSQTRGNLKALEMCGHFLLTGMFSVQVPDWCLNKRSVVLFLEAQFFCLNNKTLHPFYKGLLSQRAGRIYRSPLINSHTAYCLICLRCRAKWF